MRYFYLIAVASILFAATPARAAVQIFACEPEWAALADAIGGKAVKTFTATTARQNPHHIRAKPSLIAAMRKADLVICTGASLEVGWLPILLQKAGNANVQPGSPGYLLASETVTLLEKPAKLDRADGDIHPEGNPHLHLNPHNIAAVAEELAMRLQAIDAVNTADYQMRYNSFSIQWQNAIAQWEKEAEALKGTSVVVHHQSFAYLIQWLGLKHVGSLEPKPGIPPTTAHLESLLQTLKSSPAQAIIRTPYEPENAAAWLTQKTGTRVLVLPYTIGGDHQASDLFTLFDRTLALLKEAKRV